jgi:TPR repeat protein
MSAPLPTLQRVAKPLVHPSYSLNLNRPDEVLNPAPGIDASGGLVPVERYYSAKKRQLLAGVLLGICFSAGATWAAHKYSNYRHHAENAAAATSEESALAKNEVQVTPSSPQSGFVPSAPGADIFSGSPPITGVVSKPTPGKHAATPNAYAPFHSQAFPSKAPKQSLGTPGLPLSSGTPNAGKRPKTPRQLWSAVQSGNSNAAVALAELYIKGEGVPQNCQQARVLLLMASEKRNAAAIKRLQELDKDKTTCP